MLTAQHQPLINPFRVNPWAPLFIAALAVIMIAAFVGGYFNFAALIVPTHSLSAITSSAVVGCGVSANNYCYDGISAGAAVANNLVFYSQSCSAIKNCAASFVIAGSSSGGSGGSGTTPPPPTVPDYLNPARVLVIINDNSSDSHAVGSYYSQRRNVPMSNLCLVDTPVQATISWNEFVDFKNQVADCITETPNTIYYLLTTYDVPYLVNMDDSGRVGDKWRNEIALDSALTLAVVPVSQLPDPTAWHTWRLAQSNSNPYFAGENNLMWYDITQPRQPFDGNFTFAGYPIYLVTRLDGPSATVAQGLVDKALIAENGGIFGQACLDLVDRFNFFQSLNEHIRKTFFVATANGLDFTADQSNQVIGNEADVNVCDDIMIYAGTYNNQGYFANALDWQPGAVAAAIHSVNAKSLRLSGPDNGPSVPQEQWVAAALDDGLTAALASAAEPNASNMFRTPMFYHYWLRGYNLASAAYASIPYLFFTHVVIGDPLYHITTPIVSGCEDQDGDYFGTCGYPLDCNDDDLTIRPDTSYEPELFISATADSNGDGILDDDLDGDGQIGCQEAWTVGLYEAACCDDCLDNDSSSINFSAAICPISFSYTTNVEDAATLAGWLGNGAGPYWLATDVNGDGSADRFILNSETPSEFIWLSEQCLNFEQLLYVLPADFEPGTGGGPIYMNYDQTENKIMLCRHGDESNEAQPFGVEYLYQTPLPISPWQ